MEKKSLKKSFKIKRIRKKMSFKKFFNNEKKKLKTHRINILKFDEIKNDLKNELETCVIIDKLDNLGFIVKDDVFILIIVLFFLC